jgi:hypothetical protein
MGDGGSLQVSGGDADPPSVSFAAVSITGVEHGTDLDPLWRYRGTKASAGRCSSTMCDEPAIILVTAPHGRNGRWTRGLCRFHAAWYRHRAYRP